jgi:hypothetical protein
MVDNGTTRRSKRRGLIGTGILLMIISSVVGFGMAAYAMAPMISGFLALSSGSHPTVEMPGEITLPEGYEGGIVASIQSGGALPASCKVSGPDGEPVALQQARTFGSGAQASDGRQIRVQGMFVSEQSGQYTVSCEGSGDFGVVEYDAGRSLWLLPSLLGFPVFAVGAVLVVVGVLRRRPRGVESENSGGGGGGGYRPTNNPENHGDTPLGSAPPAPAAPSPAERPAADPDANELPRRYGG